MTASPSEFTLYKLALSCATSSAATCLHTGEPFAYLAECFIDTNPECQTLCTEAKQMLAVEAESIFRTYLMQFMWRTDMENIPLDKPVLVKQVGHDMPFVGIRSPYDEDNVDCTLHTHESGYGWPQPLSEISRWTPIA